MNNYPGISSIIIRIHGTFLVEYYVGISSNTCMDISTNKDIPLYIRVHGDNLVKYHVGN